MKISVLGTGSVGQAIASKLVSIGHIVFMGTRDVEASRQKMQPDGWGNPAIGTWIVNNPAVTLCSFHQAVEQGSDLIVFAMNGNAVFDCLASIENKLLESKILLDISNPLDFSNGFPPTLTVCNTDSLGEQIQRAYPMLKVVKSLNTMTNAVMVNPTIIEGDHTVFVSGNDADAKAQVTSLLESFGWQPNNIIDLGDITTARGTEMILPLWVRLYGKFKTGHFNFHVKKA